MFSDLNYIFYLDKENSMSHKYFIRKIKTWELVLQIRCPGSREKIPEEVEFQKENQWRNSE